MIASKIQGTVKVLYVNDNQFVKKNNLTIEIDPIDHDVRVKEARAGLQSERARLSELTGHSSRNVPAPSARDGHGNVRRWHHVWADYRPSSGRWITDNWSWRWIFYINVPIGFISIFMTLLFIVNPPYMERIKMKIDYWGLFFIAVGLGCLQVVLDKGQREDWFSS